MQGTQQPHLNGDTSASAPHRSDLDVERVAAHYDELDQFYRELWGEHIHHGLWQTGDETAEEAVIALADYVAEIAGVGAGTRVVDIGSGYGATARRLAEQLDADVTAITVSRAQHEYARHIGGSGRNPRYVHRDWLDNDLPTESFDVAVAIESTEHLRDLPLALREIARVLVPGGRLVVCAWLAGNTPGRWATRWLLQPICREGRLCQLLTEQEFSELLDSNGFAIERFDDLSAKVVRTWTICLNRVLRAFISRPDYWRFMFDRNRSERIFLVTLLRIRLAYARGAMRYGVFAARRKL